MVNFGWNILFSPEFIFDFNQKFLANQENTEIKGDLSGDNQTSGYSGSFSN